MIFDLNLSIIHCNLHRPTILLYIPTYIGIYLSLSGTDHKHTYTHTGARRQTTNSGMPTMLPAVWTTKFRNVFADIVNMCVCMYVVIMYTHTHAFICLQAIAWMQSAAAMQRNKSRWQVFFVVVSLPLALCLLIRGCTGCVVGCLCYSLVGVSVSRRAAVLWTQIEYYIFDMNAHTHTHKQHRLHLYTLFFCLNIFMYNKNRTQATLRVK